MHCRHARNLRAATDRPVARAWIAYRPDQAMSRLLPALAPLGAGSDIAVAGLDMLAREVWAEIPVAIGRDGTLLETTFIPRLTGAYAFGFEDSTGLGSMRMFDIRVTPDPAPAVVLERPSASRDSLLVLPDAEITLAAKVADKQFAIRSVWLEKRLGQEPVNKLPWFAAGDAGRLLPAAAMFMRGVIPQPPVPPLRLRPRELTFGTRLPLCDSAMPTAPRSRPATC